MIQEFGGVGHPNILERGGSEDSVLFLAFCFSLACIGVHGDFDMDGYICSSPMTCIFGGSRGGLSTSAFVGSFGRSWWIDYMIDDMTPPKFFQ